MSARFRAAVVGFAFANLFLLALTGPLVSPRHELVFHLPGSATRLFVPVILDLLLVWAALTACLAWARPRPRAKLLLWSGLLLALPSGLCATVYGFGGRPLPKLLAHALVWLSLAAFVAVNAGWRRSASALARLEPLLLTLFTFLALPALLLCGELLAFGWAARNLNPPFIAGAASRVQPGAASPRVVWIILDELSYDQLFEHRFRGLALPNFDRLAAESTVMTNAIPTAEYTREAVPSLLTGQALAAADPSSDGQRLVLVDRHTRRANLFAPEATVFADAQRAGLFTGVAGWYEPYCRLLPGVLNRCVWTYTDELPGGLSLEGSLLSRTVRPFAHCAQLDLSALGLRPRRTAADLLDVRRHRSDYETLSDASDALLRERQPGLLLIHMPIPHPWGFFDRHTGAFPDHQTSYLDNLALADAYLGRVREELMAEGLWDSTNLLVMGDHSWRTAGVWSHSAHWMAEEQVASRGGAFDPRPAVLLKLSGEHAGARLDAPFDCLRTRALIDALLRGEIKDATALGQWVRADPGNPRRWP